MAPDADVPIAEETLRVGAFAPRVDVETFTTGLANAFERVAEKEEDVTSRFGLSATGAIGHLRAPHWQDPDPDLLQRISFPVSRQSNAVFDHLKHVGGPVDRGDPKRLWSWQVGGIGKAFAKIGAVVWLQFLGNCAQAA